MIAGNVFDRSLCPAAAGTTSMNRAVIQFAACTPAEQDKSTLRPAVCVPGTTPGGPDPYFLPPCQTGGSTAPPVINHAWTPGSGLGRVAEPGLLLTGQNNDTNFSHFPQ